jgi:hypothetical protein
MLLTESKKEGDIILYETPHGFGRKVFLAAAAIVIGQVLQTSSATEKTPVVLTAVNQVVTVTTTGTTSAGTFTLLFPQLNGSVIETGPIAYNANVAAVQTAIDNALGGTNKIVAGGTIAALTLTYSGTDHAGTLFPLPTVVTAGLTGATKVEVVLTTAGAAALAGADSIALSTAAVGEKVLVLERGPAIVKKNGLTYAASATDNQKAAADALLLALGIQVRAGV